MPKRTRDSDSDGTTTTASGTVFVDTSLGTHLAMIVSDTDTVAELKEKIMYEHPQCFPAVGKIKIHALKVKRKGYFYHLSDSMLVKSAFEGLKRNWFLSVDASCPKAQNESLTLCGPDTSNQPALHETINYPSADRNSLLYDGPSNRLAIINESSLPQPGSTEHANPNISSTDHSLEKLDLQGEENHAPETYHEPKADDTRGKSGDVQHDNAVKGFQETELPLKKTKKAKKNNGSAMLGGAFVDNGASFCASSKDTSAQKTIAPCDDAGRGGIFSDTMLINGDVGKEAHHTLSQDTHRRSDIDSCGRNVLCKETEDLKTRAERKNRKSKKKEGLEQQNISLQEDYEGEPSARKKHKKENTDLDSNSGKEKSKPETIVDMNSVADRERTTKAPPDSPITKPLEDAQLVHSPSGGKKKNKKKLSISRDQLVSTTLSSMQNGGERSMKKESHQLGEVSDSPRKSLEKKHSEPVQEAVEENDAVKEGTFSDAMLISTDANKEAHDPLSLDTHRRPDTETCGRNVLSTETEDLRTHAERKNGKSHNRKGFEQSNISLHEDSQCGPSARKKHKKRNKDEGYTSLTNLVPNSGIENSNLETIVRINPINNNKEKIIEASSDSLITKPLEGAQLIHSPNDGKRKQKKKKKPSISQDQIESSMLSSTQSGGEGSLREDGKFNIKDLKKVSDAALAPGESRRLGVADSLGVSLEKKHSEPVQEAVEENEAHHTSMRGIGVIEPSDGTIKGKEDAPKVADPFGLKGPEKTKKQYAADAKGDFPVQVKEIDCLKTDSAHARPEDIVPAGEKCDPEQTKIQEDKASQNHNPQMLFSEKSETLNLGEAIADSTVAVVSANLSDAGMKKKKRRAQKSSAGLQFSSDKEHEDNSILGTAKSSQAPSSHTLGSEYVGRPHKAALDSNATEIRSTDDANVRSDSRSDGGRINFKDYFVPAQDSDDVAHSEVLVDKVHEAKRSDEEAKKKMKNTIPPEGTSGSLQDSVKAHRNQESVKKSHDINGKNSRPQESQSKDELSDFKLQSNKKSSKVAETGFRTPNSQNNKQIKSSQESRLLNNVNGSRMNSSSSAYLKNNSFAKATSTSSSESSDGTVQNKMENKHQSSSIRHPSTVGKTSIKKVGDVVNSSQHKNHLLARPGAIFRDDSSESSENENGAGNSSASTRTPSDNSSSSGFSEGEGTKVAGSKNIKQSVSSGPKNISMQMILKSSSRFKKAKLSASQSQHGDSESQPVDFVPDSQGIV